MRVSLHVLLHEDPRVVGPGFMHPGWRRGGSLHSTPILLLPFKVRKKLTSPSVVRGKVSCLRPKLKRVPGGRDWGRLLVCNDGVTILTAIDPKGDGRTFGAQMIHQACKREGRGHARAPNACRRLTQRHPAPLHGTAPAGAAGSRRARKSGELLGGEFVRHQRWEAVRSIIEGNGQAWVKETSSPSDQTSQP